MTRYYTFTLKGSKACHASVEWVKTKWIRYGHAHIQSIDGQFYTHLSFYSSFSSGKSTSQLEALQYNPDSDFNAFWLSGQAELALLLRGSIQFFLRLFPETTEITVNDHLNVDNGLCFSEGRQWMYVSPLWAAAYKGVSWFAHWFPVISGKEKEFEESEESNGEFQAFLERKPEVREIMSEAWVYIGSLGTGYEECVKRLESLCSQHSTWRSLLKDFSSAEDPWSWMHPWLPVVVTRAYGRGQTVCLDAVALFGEPKVYMDDSDGSEVALVAEIPPLNSVKGTFAAIVIDNQPIYTTCLSWADVEDD